MLLPLRHPSLVAKQAASLDYVSGGRLLLGLGVGGEGAADFVAAGVPVEERGARANEGIEALRVLLRDRPASFAGRFYRFADVSIEPPPDAAGRAAAARGRPVGRRDPARRPPRRRLAPVHGLAGPLRARARLARRAGARSPAASRRSASTASCSSRTSTTTASGPVPRRSPTSRSATGCRSSATTSSGSASSARPRSASPASTQYRAAGAEHISFNPAVAEHGFLEQVRRIRAVAAVGAPA